MRAGTAQGRGVDRVDGVDAVLEEQAFTPVDHLITGPGIERVPGKVEVAEHVGVEQLDALELRKIIEVTVVERAVGLVAVGGMAEVDVVVIQRVVVPGFAANECAVVFPVQLHFTEHRHGGRHQVALVPVQATVIDVARAVGVVLSGMTAPDAVGVALEDVIAVGVFSAPHRTHADATVGSATDFSPLKLPRVHGLHDSQ
ncbi:hypothetical protein D3C87_1390790 [compost metagenome]